MPGNELGDRVYNFFAQDNTLQGQHHSQVVEGNWAVASNNYWVGGQGQTEVSNSNNRNYNLQNAETDRGQGSYPLHITHGLKVAQSNLSPDFAKLQSRNEQPNLNGFMYGNPFHQTSQNETNFLAVDTGSEQHHVMTSRGSSVHELQPGNGPDHQAKALVKSEASASPGFDLFGGQQQMNDQQSSILQQLQHQQSGLSDMQQLHQQLMIGRMQEFQMQQQLQQVDLRQQNLINQVSPFAKQALGSQSTLVNSTPISNRLQNPWTAEIGANWLNRGSATMQGSANGLAFSPNLGQTQQLMDMVPQQVDQSFYGVPVSSARGLNESGYSHMMRDRSSPSQIPASGNSLQRNQHNLLPGHVGAQDGSSIPRHKFQNEYMLSHASSHSVNTGIRHMGGLQQVNFMPTDAHQQEFLGRQEVAVRPEILHENPTRQVSSSRDEVALDPTEEKILFGSDDNMWDGFDKMPHMSGEAGNSFNHGGLSNGLPSIQSGSWSALMQSAVAETSGSDVLPQEEWSGLIFNNNDGPSANQPSSVHNDSGHQEATLVDNSMRMPSGLSSGSIPHFNGMNSNNVVGLNQTGQKFKNESGKRLQTEMSKQLVQSVEEASKWSNCSPLEKSVAEGSRLHRNASHHPLEAERNAKTISTPWAPGQPRTRQQPNTLNAILPGGDRVLNNHEAEKLSLNFPNNQLRVMEGDVVHGSSLWKSNSIPSSSTELGPLKFTVGNTQANKGILSLNDASSASISSNVRVGDETSPYVQNNYLINHWKDANASAKYQGGESFGRMAHQVKEPNQVLDSMKNCVKEEFVRREMDNSDLKENSSDSHHSNLSQHISGGFRQSGLSDATESRPLPTGKQKSTDQLSRKASVSRKFQYHPMGNLDEFAEPTNGLKQPTNVQPMSQQNIQFAHPNIFGQVPGKSTSMEKGQSSELQRDNRGSEEEPSRVIIPDHGPNMSVPFSRPFDAYTSNKTSSSSQNMLELLHKVDQSRDHGAMMQFSASSELPEAEKFDGVGSFQRNQSSGSRGFGLQLGPPSQRLQTRDHPLNAQTTVMSFHTNHAAAETGQKDQQIVPPSSVQSLPFASVESQVAADYGRAGDENSPYKTPGNFPSVSGSGIPYSKSHLKRQQIKRMSGQIPMNRHIDSPNENASCSAQRGLAENVFHDASVSTQQDNLSSSRGLSQERAPNDMLERVPDSSPIREHLQAAPNFTMSSISQQADSSQMLHSMLANVPTDQHRAHFHKVSSHYPESFQPNIVESSSALLTYNSHGAVYGEKQKLNESSGQPAASGTTNPVSKMKESLGKSSSIKNYSDDSPAMEKDIEVFGRSLKPNNLSHQNYSLLNQLRDLKDAESNPSNMVSKRMKVTDNILDVHQMALKPGQHNDHNAVVGDSLGSNTGVAPDNSRMLSPSEPADNLQRNSSRHGSIPSQDVLALGRNVSLSKYPSGYTTSARNGHPEVSPQMAPSWFNQYGTFKNGNMLPMYDSRKVTPLRPGDLPFTLGNSSSGLDTLNSEDKGTAAAVGACQNGNSHSSIPSSIANREFSSQSSQLISASQQMVILRPKKRQTATSELHPWHKDISDSTQNCWTLSVAEADWSKAAIRLAEKPADDAELIEDGPPVLRSKRRLILTRQLMQQLLRPAPAAILSADASLNYESVAYSVSRAVLGDACNIVSSSSNLDVPSEDINIVSAKCKLLERNGDQRSAEVIEELMERARKLENDFSRLDKSASILDLKVESLDLEKFSVINRFARFHGRGQTDSAEATPTDMAAATQRSVPQRYVTALPMPRSLPDRVQCLSL